MKIRRLRKVALSENELPELHSPFSRSVIDDFAAGDAVQNTNIERRGGDDSIFHIKNIEGCSLSDVAVRIWQ